MKQEQIKTLLVNMVTITVVAVVLIAGYFAFVKNDSIVPGDVNVLPSETSAQATALVGIDIARTMKVLEDLERSVKDSVAVFGTSAFNNLTDFSVEIPKEAVGRENPFAPTEWKLRIKALEDAVSRGPAKEPSKQTASIIPQTQTTQTTQTQEQGSLLSDAIPDTSRGI